MKRKNKAPRSSIKLAFVFFIFVVVFIAISLVFKVSVLIANSKYNNDIRFTLKVANGKDLIILSFAPSSQSISKLEIFKAPKDLNINKFLGIPTEGFVVTTLNIKEGKISDLMQGFFLNYGKLETDLTIIDMVRLYLFAKTIPNHNILEKSISASLSSTQLDKIVGQLFKDGLIEKENAVIEVVNTTDTAGLGARLARVISNMGGNVVIVKSSERLIRESVISYFGKKTYTVKKLEKILGYKSNLMDTKTIADIVIMIGADSIGTKTF